MPPAGGALLSPKIGPDFQNDSSSIQLLKERPVWTKKDIAELKAHSKSRTPVSKISKVMKRTVGALRRKAGIVGIRLGHRR